MIPANVFSSSFDLFCLSTLKLVHQSHLTFPDSPSVFLLFNFLLFFLLFFCHPRILHPSYLHSAPPPPPPRSPSLHPWTLTSAWWVTSTWNSLWWTWLISSSLDTIFTKPARSDSSLLCRSWLSSVCRCLPSRHRMHLHSHMEIKLLECKQPWQESLSSPNKGSVSWISHCLIQ